jgi:hypothetical protein
MDLRVDINADESRLRLTALTSTSDIHTRALAPVLWILDNRTSKTHYDTVIRVAGQVNAFDHKGSRSVAIQKGKIIPDTER